VPTLGHATTSMGEDPGTVRRRCRANLSPADHTKSLRVGTNSRIYAHSGFDLRLLGCRDGSHALPPLVAVLGSSLSQHSQWNAGSSPRAG
jgi:hypothetical protein